MPALSAAEWLSAFGARPADAALIAALDTLDAPVEQWIQIAQELERQARAQALLDVQIAAWRAAAKIHARRLAAVDRAAGCWKRVLALDPNDGEAAEALSPKAPVNPTEALLHGLRRFEEGGDRRAQLPELERLAAAADARDELIEAVEAASESATDDAEVAELLRFVARAKPPAAARVHWNDLLALRPADSEALDQLFKIFKAGGEARPAAEIARRRAHAGPDRVDRLLEAAGLFEDAGALDDALDALEAALGVPADARVVKALQRLLTDGRRPALQARVLEATGGDAPTVHRQRAKLLQAIDPAAAAAAWARAAQGGFVPDAIAGLRALLDGPARTVAATALAPLHRARKETRLLAETLEIALEAIDARAEQVARLGEIAGLWEQLKEPRAALRSRLRAFALSSGDEGVRAELHRLATAMGAEEELLAAYEDKIESGAEANPGGLWRRIAELHDAAGDRAAAISAWEKAVTADVGLLPAYAARCRATGDLARLASVLKRQADATADAATRAAHLEALATLADDQLSDPAQAAWAVEQLSERDPADRGLLARLQRLYEKGRDLPRWADALARDLALARRAGARDEAEIALKLATLKLDSAADDAGAFELLREVERLQPGNAACVAALVRLASGDGPMQKPASRLVSPLLESRGDRATLIGMLTAQASVLTDPAERASLWARIAGLSDADGAFLASARALRELPHDPALLQRCVALAAAAGANEELALLLEELAGNQPAGPARAELSRALARCHEAAGDHDEAISAWTRVRGDLPDDAEAHRQLQALLEQAGRGEALAVLLDERAKAADPAERPAALLALAGAREKLGQLEGAAETLLALFAIDPNPQALAALERVLGKLNRHRERAEVLGRLAAGLPEGRGRNDRLIQQAKAWAAAGEPETAVALCAEILRASPLEDRVVAELVTLAPEPRVKARVAEALEPVYRDAEHRWQRLAVLDVLVANAEPHRERTWRTELAGLYEALGEHRQAFVERLRLVRADVADATARAAAEQLATSAGLEEELAGAYEDLLEARPPRAVALDLSESLARVYGGRLADADASAKWWAEVARLDPESLAAHEALSRLHRAAGRFGPLAKTLAEKARVLPQVDAQLAAYVELAAVAEDALADFPLAAHAWREVLARSPDHLVALGALGRVLERLNLPAELAEVLRRRLKVADQPPDAIADAQVRLGQLMLGPLEQPDVALAAFEQAMAARPGDAGAVEGLEALVGRAPLLTAPIAILLERTYRANGDQPRLARALALQAQGPRGPAIHEELASIYEGLGRLPEAFEAKAEVFRRAPDDGRVRAELERLADAAGQVAALVPLYRGQLQGATDGLALELWRRLAATHGKLRQPKEAAEAWEEVARRRPGDEAPLIALTQLYRTLGRVGELPRLLKNRAELQPALADQLALLHELVDLAEHTLNDMPLAIEGCRLAYSRAPDDARTIEALERLLTADRRYEALAQLLTERIAGAADAGALTVRLAQVKLRHQSDDTTAVRLLRGVLDGDPGHSGARGALAEVMRAAGPSADGAAAILEPLFAQDEAWAPLLEVLSARAAFAAGAPRAAFMHRAADLQEGKLSAPEAALATLSGVLREQPADARALQRVLDLGASTKAGEAVAGLLGEVLPGVHDDGTREAMLRPLARLREDHGDADGALEAWRALLAIRPADDEALAAALRLLEVSWRWAELAAVLEARLPHARDDAERIALLARIGRVREDSLADPRGGYSAWRRVLELSANDRAALGHLDRLCGQLQLSTELAEILARRIHLEPEQATALRLRLADVRRTKLDDRESALPLLAEVLQADPGNAAAVAQLEQCLPGEADFGVASDLLYAAWRHLDDVPRLTQLLEQRAGRAGVPARRRALFVELARLRLERQDDAALGFTALARAYREAPRDASMRNQLIALAGRAGSHAALAAVLEETLAQQDPDGAAQTSLALGEAYEGPLKDPERAAIAYRRALTGQQTAALAGLDRVLEGLGRWAELLPVLEASLATVPASGQTALLIRLAAVADQRLGKADRAAEALEQALQREPANLGAARTLEALYERTKAAAPQRKVLEHLLKHVPPLDRQAVRLKLATLTAEADPERAIALGRELLADDPLHLGGFTLLKGHFEAQARHGDLGQLLRARRGVTLDPNEVASLEFQLGELAYRKLGTPEPAIAHYREVLERARTHAGALKALVEIYGTLGQNGPLAQALGDLADAPDAAADRRINLLKRAEVLVGLGARDLSLAAARAALALVPTDVAELARVRAVFAGYDAAPEIAQTLDLLAAAQLKAHQPRDAIARFLELAAVRERLNERPLAIAALQRVLGLEPSNRAAFDEARNLYGRAEAWAETARLLAAYLPHLQAAEKPVTLDELAELHEEHLDDAEGAFEWACQAVKLDPTPTSRRERAERLAKALGHRAELARLYEQVLAGLAFGPAHERMALVLAGLQDDPIDQVDAAERTLLALLAHEPQNGAAIDQLVRMFARRGLYARQAKAMELKLDATTAEAGRAEQLKAIAVLHEQKLSDVGASAHALRRLIELTHDTAAATELAALHRRHHQWPQTRDALQVKVQLSSGTARAAAQLELAGLCENELDDSEAAVMAYQQALSFDPASSPAFVALHRLYKELDRPGELLRAIEQRLTLATDVPEQVGLLFEAAELWEKKGGPLQADQRLEKVLKLRPQDEKALVGLQRLRRQSERWSALGEALARHVDVAAKPLQRAQLCGELGELHHTRLRDDDVAVKWWRRSLDLVPEFRPAFAALGALHALHHRWLEATRMIEQEAKLEPDLKARAELIHRAALIFEDRLKDADSAATTYGRALAADPIHLPSLRRLRAIHQRAGNWPGYEQTLAQEGEHAVDAVDRAAASLALGKHLHLKAQDRAGAIRWYGHAFANDPASLEASVPLVDLLVATADWKNAAQIGRALIALLEQAGPPRRAERVKRVSQLGAVERELGHIGLSLQAYEEALTLDPTEAGALKGRGELLELAGRMPEAAQQYEKLLAHHEKALPVAERAELWNRLTRLARAMGDGARAIATAEKALEADAVNAVALRNAIALSDAAAAWERAAAFRQRLAGVAKGDERYTLLFELGKIAQDRLNNPTLAITGYSAALEARPDALEVLERIHVAFRAAGQMLKSAELQEALIAHPKLGEDARQQQTLALASLLGGTLRELDRAVAVLEAALDRSPQFGKALELLEALLTESRQWKTLDGCYQRLIVRLERLPATTPRRAMLWRILGDLRSQKLKDESGALESYATGARLAPDEAAVQEGLADFAAGLKGHEPEAIAAYVRAIPGTSSPARVCSALAKLYERRGDRDSMLLSAGAVAALGAAGPDEVRMLREGQVARATQLRAPVSEQQWQSLLLHPSLRGSLGQLMALIFTQGGSRYAADLGDFKLHPKKHRIELSDAKDPAVNNLRHIARSLGFEALNAYSPFLAGRVTGKVDRHPDEAIGVRVNPTAPLSVFIGEPLLREADLPGLTASLAATLAVLRPELSMAVLLRPEELALVIEAALQLGDPQYVMRGDPKLLKAEVKRLSKALTSDGKIAATRLAVGLLRSPRRSELAATYLDGVRHTAARAAMLVSGDFAPVLARALPLQSTRAQYFLRELLVFAVGGELHALRTQTGSDTRPPPGRI